MTYPIIQQGLIKNIALSTVAETVDKLFVEPTICSINETGCIYRYVDGDTTPADGISVIEVNGGAGRLKQITQYNGQEYMNAYNSSSLGLSSTPQGIAFDVERVNTGIVNYNVDEIIFNNADTYEIIVTVSTQNSSGTRYDSGFYIAEFDGTNWNKIPGTDGYLYNRDSVHGETTATVSFIYDASQAGRIKVFAYSDSTTISTIAQGCMITIFKFGGPRGDKGEKGDVGPSGDINRMGAYDNGTTYNINDTVEYNGSSYRCNTNGTIGTPPPSTEWELVAQKGADGAGSTVNVSEDGSVVENASNINFVGFESVIGDGGGNVTITNPKNEYILPIRAEENAALSSNTYEWAFGNGANTPVGGGVIIYVPAGYKAYIVAMGLHIGAGTATVELVINGTLQGTNADVEVATGTDAINELTTPAEISNGARLNFHTVTASGTTGPCTATAFIKYIQQ